MIIRSIYLKGYKYLLPADIHELKVTMTAPIQIIIGDNGSGKSSYCRELTPLAATSTDYQDDGYKQIVIEHNGHVYTISSSLKTTKGHSFIKDGEELNVSGTTTTQNDLVRSELGYTQSIRNLLDHNTRICNIKQADRKSQLMALYPSDLSFLLKHQQNVSSENRVCGKLILEYRKTQAELTNQLIPEKELEGMQATLSTLLQLCGQIDTDLYTCRTENERLTNTPESRDTLALDLEQCYQRAKSLLITAVDLRLHESQIFLDDDISMTQGILQATQASAESELKQLTKLAQELAAKISEYEQLLDSTIKDELKELDQHIEVLKQRYTECGVDPLVPKLTISEIATLENTIIPKVKYALAGISGTKVWTTSALSKGAQRLQQWSSIRQDLIKHYNYAKDQVETAQRRLTYHLSIKPKDGCEQICELRINFERIRQNDEQQLTKAQQDLLISKQELTTLERRYTRLQNAIASPRSMMPYMKELEDIFGLNSWGKWILYQSNLRKMINTNSSRIVNLLTLILNNSKRHQQREILEQEITGLLFKRQTIASVNRPATEMISKTLIEQQVKLQHALTRMTSVQELLQQCVTNAKHITTVNLALGDLDKLHRLIERYAKAQIVQHHLQMNNELIQRYREAKEHLTRKIAAIELTVRQQEHIKTRLYDGILPMIAKTEKRQKVLTYLEAAFSTTTGLSQVYMARFLNLIINNVNVILKSIMSYEIKILPIDENKDLTYLFPVEVNHNSVIKDIDMCSDGQKEIIDIAWTITLAKILDVLHLYPLKLDEPDKGMSSGNRGRILDLLSKLTQQGVISQLILVNHHASLYSSFAQSEVLCLSENNITVPAVYNEHVVKA